MAQITESARDGVPHSFNATDDARDDRGEVEVVAMVAMVPVVVVRDVDVVRVVAVMYLIHIPSVAMRCRRYEAHAMSREAVSEANRRRVIFGKSI